MTHAFRPLTFCAALFCLSACNEDAPPAPAARTTVPASTIEGAAVTDAKTIPEAFRGSWAASAGDCETGATRVDIERGGLAFARSTGAVSSVTATGPDEIRITVKLAGEGALSQRSFRYRLIDGGEALFDVRSGLTRARCPA
ncbi:MAG TPA: hypothetical protein VF138_06205 [Caulobacteraceae bacterium]